MKIQSGHIPVEIVYIIGNKTSIEPQLLDGVGLVDVVPISVFDAIEEKKIEKTANNLKNFTKNPIKELSIIKFENKPITGIRVLTKEYGKNEKVFKAVSEEGYFFEIDEDVLLETMLTNGVKPGGVLIGEFLWASVDNEMKLVRKDSKLFNTLLEIGDRSFLSFIEKDSLEIGGVYESRRGKRMVFLGHVISENWKMEWPDKKSAFFNTYVRTSSNPTLQKKNASFLLWANIPSTIGRSTMSTTLFLNKALTSPILFHVFSLSRSSTVVKKIYSVPTPANSIALVRNMAVAAYEIRIKTAELELKKKERALTGFERYEFKRIILDAVPCCLMRDPKMPRPVIDEPRFQELEALIGKVVSINN